MDNQQNQGEEKNECPPPPYQYPGTILSTLVSVPANSSLQEGMLLLQHEYARLHRIASYLDWRTQELFEREKMLYHHQLVFDKTQSDFYQQRSRDYRRQIPQETRKKHHHNNRSSRRGHSGRHPNKTYQKPSETPESEEFIYQEREFPQLSSDQPV